MKLIKGATYVATKSVEYGLVRPKWVKAGTEVRLEDATSRLVGIVTPPELPWNSPESTYGALLTQKFLESFELVE